MVLLDNLIIFLTNLAGARDRWTCFSSRQIFRNMYVITIFGVGDNMMKFSVSFFQFWDCGRNVLTTYFYSPFI